MYARIVIRHRDADADQGRLLAFHERRAAWTFRRCRSLTGPVTSRNLVLAIALDFDDAHDPPAACLMGNQAITTKTTYVKKMLRSFGR